MLTEIYKFTNIFKTKYWTEKDQLILDMYKDILKVSKIKIWELK